MPSDVEITGSSQQHLTCRCRAGRLRARQGLVVVVSTACCWLRMPRFHPSSLSLAPAAAPKPRSPLTVVLPPSTPQCRRALASCDGSPRSIFPVNGH